MNKVIFCKIRVFFSKSAPIQRPMSQDFLKFKISIFAYMSRYGSSEATQNIGRIEDH
jgi:hypothetical protein